MPRSQSVAAASEPAHVLRDQQMLGLGAQQSLAAAAGTTPERTRTVCRTSNKGIKNWSSGPLAKA